MGVLILKLSAAHDITGLHLHDFSFQGYLSIVIVLVS